MALTFVDVVMVAVTSIAFGLGLGLGVGLVHLSALSFMRYACDYLEHIKKHKTQEQAKPSTE